MDAILAVLEKAGRYLLTIRITDLLDIAIMAYLVEQYGTTEEALSAYNTGSPDPTVYAASVLSTVEDWR